MESSVSNAQGCGRQLSLHDSKNLTFPGDTSIPLLKSVQGQNPTLGSYPVSFPRFLLRCWVRPPDWTQQHHMQYQPGEYSGSPKLMTFLAQDLGRTNTAGAFKVRTLCDPMKIAHVLSAEQGGSFLGRKAQNTKEVPKVI